MGGSEAERAVATDSARVAPPFGPLERRDRRWTRPMTVDQVVAMAASRSYLLALPPGERDDVLREVRALLATHPATRDGDPVAMPYTTAAVRTTRP